MVIAAAKDFAERTGDGRLELVYADDHAQGLSASLKAGLAAAIEDEVDGVFVFLGDMPRVPAAAAPVLFSSSLFDELMDLSGDKGANGLLDALGERLATAPSPDDGILFDVDQRQV
jgi:molybdenum cofactor cytidylyltransferase